MDTLERLVQSLKTSFPITVTPSSMVMLLILPQSDLAPAVIIELYILKAEAGTLPAPVNTTARFEYPPNIPANLAVSWAGKYGRNQKNSLYTHKFRHGDKKQRGQQDQTSRLVRRIYAKTPVRLKSYRECCLKIIRWPCCHPLTRIK